MGLQHRHGLGHKLWRGVASTAKALGTAHTAYKLGRLAYQVGSALAPVAAAALL